MKISTCFPSTCILILTALFWGGCLQETDDLPEKKRMGTGMYSCKGEPAYTESEFVSMLDTMRVCSNKELPRFPDSTGNANVTYTGTEKYEKANVVIMNDACLKIINEFQIDLVTAPPFHLWNLLDSDGRLVRSGQYYMNIEMVNKGGVADTSHLKIGVINNLECK